MPSQARTFLVLLEDKPGVLNRVASLFRRRAYNIDSLNVGKTHQPGVSCLTLVLDADDDAALRIEANLYKLVNVLEVRDITHSASVMRNLALIKVRVGSERRAEVLSLCGIFRAHVVDVGAETLMIELSATQSKIDSLVAALQPFGVAEMVQTGAIALTRG